MSKDQEFTLKVKRTTTTVIEVPLFAKSYEAAMKKGEKEVEKDNFDFSGGVTTIGKAEFYGLHTVKRFSIFCEWEQKNDKNKNMTIAEIFDSIDGDSTGDPKAQVNLIAGYGRDIKKDVELLEVGQCTFWKEPFNGNVCCLRVV